MAAVQREALREPAVQMPGGEHCVSVAVRGQAGCAAQTVEPSAKIPPCWLFTTQQGARSWPLAPGFRSPARVLEHLQAGHSGCRERRRATGRTCARACSAQSRWAASPPRLCWHRGRGTGVRRCADSCRWPWAGIAIGQKGVASDDGAGRWCCPWSGCAGGARGAGRGAHSVAGILCSHRASDEQRLTLPTRSEQMFAANKQTTTKLWMWRMEYLHHEQRPLYFGEWF